jgi:hypothetical protein
VQYSCDMHELPQKFYQPADILKGSNNGTGSTVIAVVETDDHFVTQLPAGERIDVIGIEKGFSVEDGPDEFIGDYVNEQRLHLAGGCYIQARKS